MGKGIEIVGSGFDEVKWHSQPTCARFIATVCGFAGAWRGGASKMSPMHQHKLGESHFHSQPATGFLFVALMATLCLVMSEFVGGYAGHSVALTSDAIHNLSDIPSI